MQRLRRRIWLSPCGRGHVPVSDALRSGPCWVWSELFPGSSSLLGQEVCRLCRLGSPTPVRPLQDFAKDGPGTEFSSTCISRMRATDSCEWLLTAKSIFAASSCALEPGASLHVYVIDAH